MIRWGFAGLIGLFLVLVGLGMTPDLRGWTPADPTDRNVVIRSTPEGRRDFTRADCLPGSIDLHAPPLGREGEGSATVSITTCRSSSSTSVWLLLSGVVILAATLTAGAASTWKHRRRPSPGADP